MHGVAVDGRGSRGCSRAGGRDGRLGGGLWGVVEGSRGRETTLISSLTGLLAPTKGCARINRRLLPY